ncbi:hypothetical protein ZHAS_00010417 [Anopheles sinensis]|uniref:Uncharacterized protein n=1 Tax=Anopheles sinensis TaxID=74873 RepID=A0A084VXF5_ANOSI|nr:hypothetical protein ZHAS_00010417 [Anopheles sinensis]
MENHAVDYARFRFRPSVRQGADYCGKPAPPFPVHSVESSIALPFQLDNGRTRWGEGDDYHRGSGHPIVPKWKGNVTKDTRKCVH